MVARDRINLKRPEAGTGRSIRWLLLYSRVSLQNETRMLEDRTF